MPDLHLCSLEEIAGELKTRNLTFLLTWVDHNEFNKSPDHGIVWGIESGGNLVLQETLLRFLRRWFTQLLNQRTRPVSHETPEP